MFEFKLPDLGEGVHEGQVVNVLVKEGDPIGEYQPMLEVETDKAAVEIPSPKSGIVSQIHVAPGQVVKVGQVLISIDDDGRGGNGQSAASAKAAGPAKPAEPVKSAESATTAKTAEPAVAASKASAGAAARPSASPPAPASRPVPTAVSSAAPAISSTSAPTAEGPVPAAPAVRKLARELNIDINVVTPTGPGGRILRENVEQFAAGGPAARGAAAVGASQSGLGAVAIPGGELPDFALHGPVRREPVPQIRKTIARQMTRAWLNVPRVTHCDKADVTELERNRKAYNTGLREGQAKLTLTAIVIKAVAAALREFPVLNCSFDATTDEIIYKDYRHIGIAVDTPRGLVVPVLRDADKKPLPQIAAELNDIGERARTARFEVNDLRGATFTITNVGAVGGEFVTPMVNFPEVGILGLGKAKLTPVVLDGQIVARLVMPLSLSFDHRVVDGAEAARFVSEVIRSLENPLRLISLA